MIEHRRPDGGLCCNSVVLIRRATGEVTGEFYSLPPINPERIEVVRTCEYLARVNGAKR